MITTAQLDTALEFVKTVFAEPMIDVSYEMQDDNESILIVVNMFRMLTPEEEAFYQEKMQEMWEIIPRNLRGSPGVVGAYRGTNLWSFLG